MRPTGGWHRSVERERRRPAESEQRDRHGADPVGAGRECMPGLVSQDGEENGNRPDRDLPERSPRSEERDDEEREVNADWYLAEIESKHGAS